MGRSENGAGGSGTPTGLVVRILPCARNECDGGGMCITNCGSDFGFVWAYLW